MALELGVDSRQYGEAEMNRKRKESTVRSVWAIEG